MSAAQSMTKMKKTSFLGGLQPRERVLVVALIGVFFFMAGLLLFYVRGQKLGGLERKVESLQRGIDLLRTQGPLYRARQGAGGGSSNTLISETPVVYGQMIEEAERQAGVSVSNQEVKPPIELEGGVVMQTVDFDLRQVTLEQLVNFMKSMESKSNRFVITRRLLVRSSTSVDDRLNAQLELVTWEKVPEAEVAAEDGDAGS